MRGGGDRIGIGAVAPEADVVGGARAEQHRILRHEREAAAKIGQRERAKIDAVERDAALLRIVEAQQQLEHRALAGAGRPDQRDRFAGFDREREIVQRRAVGPRRIAEFDMLETHRAAHRLRERVGGSAERISARVSSSSPMRPSAPAARSTSPQTSVSAPTEPPARIAYSTNWLSTPAAIVPAMTACAPAQSTSVIAPNVSRITSAVSVPVIAMRRRAVASARATAPE